MSKFLWVCIYQKKIFFELLISLSCSTSSSIKSSFLMNPLIYQRGKGFKGIQWLSWVDWTQLQAVRLWEAWALPLTGTSSSMVPSTSALASVPSLQLFGLQEFTLLLQSRISFTVHLRCLAVCQKGWEHLPKSGSFSPFQSHRLITSPTITGKHTDRAQLCGRRAGHD